MARSQDPAPHGLKRRGVASLAFDELGIALAVLLFFVVGAFSSPYFLTSPMRDKKPFRPGIPCRL